MVVALPMSYRGNRGSDSNRLPQRGQKMSASIATSNAHHGTRFPDAPRRPLAKSAERGAVPSDVYSWDSNPWSHVRVTNSPMENTRVPTACYRSMTEALPQKRRKPPGRPGGFRGNPLKTRLYPQFLRADELRLALIAWRNCSRVRWARAAQAYRHAFQIH